MKTEIAATAKLAELQKQFPPECRNKIELMKDKTLFQNQEVPQSSKEEGIEEYRQFITRLKSLKQTCSLNHPTRISTGGGLLRDQFRSSIMFNAYKTFNCDEFQASEKEAVAIVTKFIKFLENRGGLKVSLCVSRNISLHSLPTTHVDKKIPSLH